ncbi:MAG TPA: hypothetical protein VFX88_22665 [Actinomycetota bacterium]|nr:hypothetical protein [Actinomycetota bacterium]
MLFVLLRSGAESSQTAGGLSGAGWWMDTGFLLFPPDWWETAADMPIQLTLLQGGSSAFQTGPIGP